MPSSAPPQYSGELESLLRFVAQAAIDDVSPDQFLRSFQTSAAAIAPVLFGAIDDPSARRAAIGQFGRIFWSTMPRPQRGWRALPLPKPDRNGPCPCGSGKKYKKCCQPYEPPSEMMPALNMLRFVLDVWPEDKLREVPVHLLDPVALSDAAHQWAEEGNSERGIRLLEQLFDDPANLGERHAECFDELCDAYLEAGMQTEREKLVARIARHANKHLASPALQRATVLSSDVGDYASAWEFFREAMRLTPDEPSLAHLEVLVLKSEGRDDEAKARAKVWASRLRRTDRPELEELIEFLERMAEDPDRAMLELAERNRPEEDGAWTDLLDLMPEVELLYAVERAPMPDDTWGPGRVAVAMQPLPALARVEREWRDRVFVQKPAQTDLYGDASSACAEFADVVEFMRAHPSAWQSFEILDDLVLIAREWFDEDDGGAAESTVVLDLTEHAADLLGLCVAGAGEGKAVLAWGVMENRPALRLIAQRIDALFDTSFPGEAEGEIGDLQEWMLELNPNDNHGYRNPVMQGYLIAGDARRAIELAQRYPNDVGDTPFDLALALFQSGRKDEAASAWDRGATAHPEIAATLLARDPKPPRREEESGDYDDRYEVLGGPEHARRYRSLMLEAWAASGALDWAKTLPRVAVPKRRKPVRGNAGTKGRQSPAGQSRPDFSALPAPDETPLLQSLAGFGFSIVPLHGMLSALTISPRMMMPGQWLKIALELRTGAPAAGIDELNAAIQPLMALYNGINTALRMKRGDGYVPSPELPTADPVQATQWARGFMRIVEQGRAAWRDKTGTPQGKAALTAIERAAAGMVSDERLREESAALGLSTASSHQATWHDVLAAATRLLAAA